MSSHRFFYEVDHLPPGLFKACIMPRPIGWFATTGAHTDIFNMRGPGS